MKTKIKRNRNDNGYSRLLSAAPPRSRSIITQSFLTPAARARWQSVGMLNQYTPKMVEMLLMNAAGGDLVSSYELFDLMEATWPHLNKNLNELKDAVVCAKWNVHPFSRKGEEPTPAAQEKAALVENIFEMQPVASDDENGFEETLYDLLDARGKGVSVLEVDWEERQGMILPRATRWVHPQWYGFDREFRLKLRDQTSGGLVDFVPDKFLIGICKSRTGVPIGAALLRTLGFWWAATNFAAEWFLGFVQIFGQPTRWATYDPALDFEDIKKLEEMLANMGASAWGLFPEGAKLELKDVTSNGSQNPYKTLMEHADKICDLLILRQTLTTDVVEYSGSRALGEVHERVLRNVKLGIARWAARILNQQLIPSIIRLNYGNTDELPYFVPSDEGVTDRTVIAQGLTLAKQLGVRMGRAWVHEELNIPQPDEDDDVLEPADVTAPPELSFQEDMLEGADSKSNATQSRIPVQAKSRATEKLLNNVLERLTGVSEEWLGGVKPVFRDLVLKAMNQNISDEDFIAALEQASQEMPRLFSKLKPGALQKAMEGAMGAAAVNGAVGAMLKRGVSRMKKV